MVFKVNVNPKKEKKTKGPDILENCERRKKVKS